MIGSVAEVVAGEAEDAFAEAVVAGLSAPSKSLPCQHFYDRRGSELFERITRLPEYYLTRTETGLLETHAAEMVEGFEPGGSLVEFGSGSSRKTESLIEVLPGLRAYVPIDVSASALEEACRRLAARFPGIALRPIRGDFSRPLTLTADLAGCRKLGFFPGSTIGNLTEREAAALLSAFRAVLAPEGRLIIGVDLVKDERTLLAAYNDPGGVTAAFNLNLLDRINRAFGRSFDLGAFRHEAVYNPQKNRIEMHLVSRRDQTAELLGRRFAFRRGERIHTENSHKYTVSGFRELAASAGWQPRRVWTDERAWFSVHELASPA